MWILFHYQLQFSIQSDVLSRLLIGCCSMRKRYVLRYTIIGAFLLILPVPNSTQPTETTLEALVDSSAKMPCNVMQRDDDGVEFIFWYKNDGVNALYTLDARRRALGEASHVRNETYGDRVRFYVAGRQPYLQLDAVRPDDSGAYFCRVDYQWSATELTKVNLLVVVPPKKLIIRDDTGNEIGDIAGPYRERSTVTLTCEAHKGVPSPNVTWWRDNKMWDTSFRSQGSSVVNDMKLASLSRLDFLATFHCKAQNARQGLPVVRTIVLDMYLYPLGVRINGGRGTYSSGRRAELSCETYGSNPPARMSWWLDGNPLPDHVDTVHDNATTSILGLIPRPSQNGAALTCRAHNPKMPREDGVEDVRVLNITYTPTASLRLITEEEGRPPKEDDYVRMVCDVTAHPSASEIGWLMDDAILSHNQSRTDIVSGNTLVFKRLTRSNSGRYRCYAINDEGRGVSQELQLNVSHAPVCKPNQRVTYAVALNRSVSVRCEVEALPADPLTFRWEFSNTVRKHYHLQHSSSGPVSSAVYTPQTPADYGTLFCWANNSVGLQQISCFFTVIAPACNTENVKVNASSLSRDGSEEVWPRVEMTTGGAIIAFVMIFVIACFLYVRRIYAERKRRPAEPMEEDISIYSRVQCNTGPQPGILITK